MPLLTPPLTYRSEPLSRSRTNLRPRCFLPRARPSRPSRPQLLAFAERLQRQSVRTVEEREQDQIRITVDVATDESEGGGVGAMVGGLGLPGMAVAGGGDKRE